MLPILVATGRPVTKKNSGVIITPKRPGARPIMIPSKEYRTWAKTAVRDFRIGWGGAPPLTEAVNLCALVYRDRRVGDLANYINAIADALEEAGVVENDRLIVGHDGSRPMVDRERPRVEVVLTVMAVHDPGWTP